MARSISKPLLGATLLGLVAVVWRFWPASPKPRNVERVDLTVVPAATPAFIDPGKHPAKPAAMSNPATYAEVRMKDIKADPAKWNDVWVWRQEFAAADTPELRREVFGLARQVSGHSVIAILQQALASDDPIIRLDASRSIAMLPENRMREGFALGFEAADPEIRQDVMDQILQIQPQLRAEILRAALAAGPIDVQQRAIDMLTDPPSPAYFGVLIEGLRSSSAQVQPQLRQAITDTVNENFRDFDEASNWWDKNRDQFDDLMTRIQ